MFKWKKTWGERRIIINKNPLPDLSCAHHGAGASDDIEGKKAM